MKTLFLAFLALFSVACSGRVDDTPPVEFRVHNETSVEALDVLTAAVDRYMLDDPRSIRIVIVDCEEWAWWACANVVQDTRSGTGLRGSFWTGSSLYVSAEAPQVNLERAIALAVVDLRIEQDQ